MVVAAYDDRYVDKCLKSLGDRYTVQVIDTSAGGYMTGAYIKAYREIPAQNYFFMHDSMEALRPDYLEPFKEVQPMRGAAAWSTFSGQHHFDTQEQHDVGFRHYGGIPYPGQGIFGAVFYTNRKSLEILDRRGLLPPIPHDKLSACGSERYWAWAFSAACMDVVSVGGEFNPTAMKEGQFPIFRKVFAERQ